MITQPPLSLKLHNRMMRRPTLDGLENPARIREGSHRRVANRVDDVMRVARAVGEVVLVFLFVHPRGFEEAAVVVVGGEGLAIGVVDDQILHGAGEGLHVWAEFGDARHQGGFIAAGFHCFVGGGVEGGAAPALELATPNPAEVEIRFAVIVDKYSRVDAVASWNRRGFWFKRTFGFVADGYADAKDAIVVPGWEVEKVLVVLEPTVWSLHIVSSESSHHQRNGIYPELLRRPRNVFQPKNLPMIRHFTPNFPHRQHMVISHIILAAIVVVGNVCSAIVRRVNIKSPVEDPAAGVRKEVALDQWFGIGHDVLKRAVCLQVLKEDLRMRWVPYVRLECCSICT